MTTITTGDPGLTVPGICHHLPVRPIVDDTVSISTNAAGTVAHADLLLGFTSSGGEIRLNGTDGDAAYFEAIAHAAARCAAWLSGRKS